MNKIIPLDDNVLIQVIEPGERMVGEIVIPATAGKQRDACGGKVLAVGPGRNTEYGARVEVTVQPGDFVLLPRIAGVQVQHDSNANMRILRCCELIAKVEESAIVVLA